MIGHEYTPESRPWESNPRIQSRKRARGPSGGATGGQLPRKRKRHEGHREDDDGKQPDPAATGGYRPLRYEHGRVTPPSPADHEGQHHPDVPAGRGLGQHEK